MTAEMMSPSLMISRLAGLHSMDHGCCATMDGLGSAAERARDARERCQGTLGDQGHLRDRKEKGKH